MIIRRLSSTLLILLFMYSSGFTQITFQQEIKFLEHLNTIRSYDEGIYYLNHLDQYKGEGKSDTLNFWRGRFHYQKKELNQSIQAYNQVSNEISDLYTQAKLLSSLQLSYLTLYDSAYNHLENLNLEEPLFKELKHFQLASISLLARSLDNYGSHSSHFSESHYQLKDYELDLKGISTLLEGRKSKSPFLAGLMSTIIPGSGKIYAGKIGQGAMSLLISGIFGLQTWEVYRKDGIKSARFIIFGGLFSSFYIANIWGSVVTVKMTNLEFNDSINEAILINMHVPLRIILN